MAEGLFDDHTAAPVAAGLRQLLNHGFEERGRDGQVMRRPLRSVEFFADRLKRAGIVVVAVYVTQQSAQLLKSRRIDSAVFLEAFLSPRSKLLEVPAGFGDTDDRHVEMTALDRRLQRRKNLLVGQVTRGTEENQRIGTGL